MVSGQKFGSTAFISDRDSLHPVEMSPVPTGIKDLSAWQRAGGPGLPIRVTGSWWDETFCSPLFLLLLSAGSAYYDNVRPLAYPDSDAVLICFDISRPETLDSVLKKVSARRAFWLARWVLCSSTWSRPGVPAPRDCHQG